jgi:HAE1 family hydrophobic/amphiphilic exporter-1
VGTAIVGGMLFSTVLNLFFIPVLYVIVKTLLTSFRKKKRPGVSGRHVIGLNGQTTNRELKVS